MDSDMLSYSLDFVVSSGHTLSVEQKAALQTSLVIVKKNYKFHRVLFWGKIFGSKDDYFIVQGRGEDEMKDRKNLYSINCIDWFLLPAVNDSMIDDVSKAARGPFTGDPSFVYEHQQSEGKENEAVVYKVNEEKRLAVTVNQIDEDASVVPRGAFIKRQHGLVEVNRSFAGLFESEAGMLDNFLHFSEPKNLKKSILEMGELNPAIDFLDVLSDDIPKGSWSLQFECGSKVCILRSMWWLGLTFYHVPMTPQHGYIYIGDGCRNLYLPFML